MSEWKIRGVAGMELKGIPLTCYEIGTEERTFATASSKIIGEIIVKEHNMYPGIENQKEQLIEEVINLRNDLDKALKTKKDLIDCLEGTFSYIEEFAHNYFVENEILKVLEKARQ